MTLIWIIASHLVKALLIDCIGILYQNVRGLRIKCTNFYDSAHPNEPKFTCIIETWLNDSFCNHSLFPVMYSVFRGDRGYTDFNLTQGGGVLIAFHHSISGYMRRYDLELTNESVWVEIPVNDVFNLLVESRYFLPKSDNKFIENYFFLWK